jgi:hypothetical protein
MNNVAFPLEKELLNYTMLPFGWVSMASVENLGLTSLTQEGLVKVRWAKL